MQRFGFFLFCPMLVAGCSDAGDSSHIAQREPLAKAWVGSQWRFDTIDGKRPASEAAGISFDGKTIVIQAGCNRLLGPWRVDEDRLIAGPLNQGEAPCEQSSWEEGNAVSALLVATPRVTVEGQRMTLQSSGHTAELTRPAD